MEVIVIIIVLVVLIALLLPSRSGTLIFARETQCVSNLCQMWKMQNIYRSQFGGRMKSMPRATGSAFWRILENTTPPLMDVISAETFLCPVKGDGQPGDLEYWGPGDVVSRLKDMEPVSCDVMGENPNHGNRGCNILRKSSDVMRITAEEWTDLDKAFGLKNVTRPIP